MGDNIVVYIRLNQDVHNTDDLLQLIDLLKERFGKYTKFKVYNHLLFTQDNLVSEEQQDCYYKLRKKIEYAKVSFNPKLISGPKANNCMADSPNSRVVTPDGKFGKCEHYSSENLVGSLFEKTIDEEMMKKWAGRIERQEACYTCPLFPVCNKIKMCPNEGSQCTSFDRETKLYSLHQAIMNTYNQYCRKAKTNAN